MGSTVPEATAQERLAMHLPTIHNVRLGFATNSSSPHSIVFWKGAKDSLVSRSCEFGWETFVCASREAKMSYLGTVLLASLRHYVGYEIAAEVVRSVTGASVPEGAYIDHDSDIPLPLALDGKGPNLGFVREFREFLLRDDVVILGGNDNSEDPPEWNKAKAVDLSLPSEGQFGALARKDPKGFWTLFWPGSGAKLRLSFDPPSRANDVTKSTYPELIDLSITDRCPAGCHYCYRDSKPDGQHADEQALYRVEWLIEELHPFEVAIGGGEPTEHPKFIDLLASLHGHGIVPTFSTRSYDWMHHNERREQILKYAARFGFSVDHGEDVTRLAQTMDRYQIPHERCTVHAIVGISAHEWVLRECARHNFGVLLLGLKRVGRACKPYEHYKEKLDQDWVSTAKRMAKEGWLPSIAADTTLCAQYQKQLKVAGVSPALYATQEGKFSMFIDAVRETMGPSSFCAGSQVVPLPKPSKHGPSPGLGWDHGAKQVLERFAKW
jgi:hypothetical protein